MRNHSVIREQIQTKLTALYGDSLSVSFPIPCKEGVLLLERFLLMRMSFSKRRSRPFGMLTVDAQAGRFLMLQDFHYRDIMDTEQYPFSDDLNYSLPADLSAEAYTATYHLLLERYDQMIGIVFSDFITKEQAEIVQDYFAAFKKIVPDALIPFYRTAGPEFFSWIEKNT